MPRSRIALEIGTHSPWISRLLSDLGHEVIVANARKVRLIGESRKKDDRLDAQTLARLARIDPELLYPVKHRSAQAQADLTVIRARAGLVRARTGLVNSARGLAKSYGERLRGCNVRNMNPEKAESLSPELQRALEPLLSAIAELSQRICEYNERIEAPARQSYPQVELLQQIKGVGTLIALTFLLTLEDPHRCRKTASEGGWILIFPIKSLADLERGIACECAVRRSHDHRSGCCAGRDFSRDIRLRRLEGGRDAVEGNTGGSLQIISQNNDLRSYFARHGVCLDERAKPDR
jgi:transposase